MSDTPRNGIFLTEDQLWAEETAYKLYTDPRSKTLVDTVGEEWIARMKPDAEHRARFEEEYRQAAYSGFMHAACDDPLHPRLYAFGRFAHETAGLPIPGTKSAHPNPDYIYRFVTIDGDSRYVIRGQMPKDRPAAAEYAMLTGDQVYQKNLSLADIEVDADGSFVMTFDPDPADGRPNHFQSTSETIQILLRDVIGDGHRHEPIALEVERTGPPPARGPRSFEEMLERAEFHVRKHIDDMSFVTENFAMAKPVNRFEPPMVQARSMYSVAQAYSASHFRIEDDEAMLIDITLAGAAYAVVPVSDIWGGVGDVIGHQVNLGTDLAQPNPDGSYTFVLALTDPGVANWIDPDGLHSGILFFRWIGLPPGAGERPAPKLETRIVTLDALKALLPEGVPRVTAEERRAMMAHRAESYRRAMG